MIICENIPLIFISFKLRIFNNAALVEGISNRVE